MIQELIKAKVDAMNANGYSYSFLHSETEWQNLTADEMVFPAVFMDMPVSFDPVVKNSGHFERKYVVVCIFLFKSNLDDNETQRYGSFKLAEDAQKQLHLMLDQDEINFKDLQVQRCYQIANFLDVNLDGVVMPFTVTERNTGSVCAPSAAPVGTVTIKLNSATFLTVDCGNTQNITLTDVLGNELSGYEVVGSNIKIKNSVVTNSEDTVLLDLAPQEYAQLPDVDNIDSDGQIVPTPAGVAFTCSPIVPCEDVHFTLNTNQASVEIPSGTNANFNLKNQDGDIITPTGITGAPYDFDIEINIPEASTGVELMKTFQTISYATSDDGALQLGSVGLVDWYTLANANPFGNTNRWTDELGGQTYANNIVIDWARYVNGQVLGYYRVILNYGNLATSVPLVASNTLGTFTGWHSSNMEEMRNIYYRNASPAYNFPPFNFNTIKYFWTSTTHTDGVQAIIDQGLYYNFTPFGKSFSLPSLACRYFTVTGTTLS